MENEEQSTSSGEATGTSVSSDSAGGSPKAPSRPRLGVQAAAAPPPPLVPLPSVSVERSYADLDAWLEKLTQGTPLTEPEVKNLTELARERFLQESNVQPVPAPVTICGDIHVRSFTF